VKILPLCLLLAILVVGCTSNPKPEADPLAEAVGKLNFALENNDGAAYLELLPGSKVSDLNAEVCQLWGTGAECMDACNNSLQECISYCGEDDIVDGSCSGRCQEEIEIAPLFKTCKEACGTSCEQFARNAVNIEWNRKVTTQGVNYSIKLINATIGENEARVLVNQTMEYTGGEKVSAEGELLFINESGQWKLSEDVFGILEEFG